MSKHSGLSRLADVAREVTGGDAFYPVKKRGERRRLNPNWVGIAWLEAESLADTEITHTAGLAPDMPGLLTLMTAGEARAVIRGMHPRRMIDVFDLDQSSTLGVRYSSPCPACQNFAVSWKCDRHGELPWDEEKRRFVRHRNPQGLAGLERVAIDLNPWSPGPMSFPQTYYDGAVRITFQTDNTDGLFSRLEGGRTDET